jgi:hypothetical protein
VSCEEIKTFRPFGLFHGKAESEEMVIENHPPDEIAVGSIFRDNVTPLIFQQELIN